MSLCLSKPDLYLPSACLISASTFWSRGFVHFSLISLFFAFLYFLASEADQGFFPGLHPSTLPAPLSKTRLPFLLFHPLSAPSSLVTQLPLLSHTHWLLPFSHYPDFLLWELRFAGVPYTSLLKCVPFFSLLFSLLFSKPFLRRGVVIVWENGERCEGKGGMACGSFLFVGFSAPPTPSPSFLSSLPLSPLPHSSGLSFFLPSSFSPFSLPLLFSNAGIPSCWDRPSLWVLHLELRAQSGGRSGNLARSGCVWWGGGDSVQG